MGEGGYGFFGKLKLKIGFQNGASSSGTAIIWTNSGDSIWKTPFTFTLLKVPLQLYEKPSFRKSIYLPEVPSGITVFGYNSINGNYADLLLIALYFCLFSIPYAAVARPNKIQK